MRNSIKLLGIYGSLLLLLAGCSITPTAQTSQDSTAKSDIITLSFIGDNVLGDYYGSNGETLNWYFNHKIGKDYSYFFAVFLIYWLILYLTQERQKVAL